MARYQLIASIRHPEESGWTRKWYPNTAKCYDKLITALSLEQIDLAKEIMLKYFATKSDAIEEHNDWTDELMIDKDTEGIWLFKRLA